MVNLYRSLGHLSSYIGIFNAPVEEVKKIMDEDPAVQAGVLIYETHACRGFPGDSLPK